MTKQTSNESSLSNAALVERLERSIPVIKERMLSELKRGEVTNAHYSRQQISTTEAIIYAIRNNRIARTDEDVERLVSGK